MENTDKLQNYWPLVSLISIAAAAGYAVTWHSQGGSGVMEWMHNFMGFFLCCFAMLKIFNLSHFANGFQMYDLLAKHNRAYALFYPFIELGLGLSYLSFIYPELVYGITVIVMFLGAVGVLIAIKKGLKIKCACMGTILNVPLSTVTLTEDIGMGAMAAIMLFRYV